MRRSFSFLTFAAGASLLLTIFPWVLAFQGTVFGHPVSVRSPGNALGVLLAAAGVSVLVSLRARERLRSLAAWLEGFPFRLPLLWALTGLYLLPVASHKLRAHYVLSTHALDLGFFSNICWNTAHGNWFMSSLFEMNFMSVHVNWILWPLSVFYKFGAEAPVLLVAQAVFLAAAVPFLWLAVHRATGSFSAGLLASVLYVCSPYIGHSMANDFHPDTWQVPCLAAALLFWQRGRRFGLLVCAFLALLAKEDVSFVLSGFGLFLLLRRGWRAAGAALLIGAGAAFFYHTQVFIPKFVEGGAKSVLFARYPLLGGSFEEMLQNLFLHPSVYFRALLYDPAKFWRLACYLFPALGLTAAAPSFLIPPLVSVLPHVLSQASTQLSLADIYALPTQPFIFVGAAYGAMKLIRLPTFAKKEFVLIGAGLIAAGLGIYMSPRYYRGQPRERLKAFHEMKKRVPAETSLAAQQNLFPHFDTRRYVQLFPIGNGVPGLQTKVVENPEYVVCDRIGNAIPYDGPQLQAAIERLEADPRYKKVYERENFLLFQRRRDEELRMVDAQ